MFNSLSDLVIQDNIGKPPEASAANSVLQHRSDATACHQSSVKVDTVVPTAALHEPVPSIKATGTEAVPPKFSPVNNGPLAKAENSSVQVTSTEAVLPKSNPVNDGLLTKLGENVDSSIQATPTKAIHPKHNPVNVEPLTKSAEDRMSSLQPINPEETCEFKPSFWSKVPSHPEGATPGWDSSGLTSTSWWS